MRTLSSLSGGIRYGFCTFFVFAIFVGFSSRVLGSNGGLTVNPSTVNFANVLVGTSQAKSVTLANSGGPKVTITQATLTGAGFTLSGLSFPVTLAGGQSVTCTVTYTPQSTASASGSVLITVSTQTNNGKGNNTPSSGSSTIYTVSLSGTAVMSSTTAAGNLAPSPSSINFSPSIQIGSSQSLPETLTNVGGSNVTISQATTSGSGFSVGTSGLPVTLSPGQSAIFTVTFAPTASGNATGNLAIASNASTSIINIPLAGTVMTPAVLSASSLTMSFGTLQLGSSQPQYETLTNSGGSSLTITQATMSGAGFSLSGLSVPQSLSPGQSVTFTLTFAPTITGTSNGTLAVASNASDPNLNITLSGTGSSPGQLGASPGSITFSSAVVVGTSATQTASLTATGASVTISSATSNSSEFAITGISLPKTLAAGQSVPFTVTFTPQASGTASGNISFLSNASNSTLSEPVSGSGTAAIQHSVDLSWSPSTSSVTGYNVYRGGTSGGPYTKINSALDSSTNYVDSSVQAGQTYYYVTTAVISTGAESAYSNQVQAVIPSP